MVRVCENLLISFFRSAWTGEGERKNNSKFTDPNHPISDSGINSSSHMSVSHLEAKKVDHDAVLLNCGFFPCFRNRDLGVARASANKDGLRRGGGGMLPLFRCNLSRFRARSIKGHLL